jgi:hypothetical protein
MLYHLNHTTSPLFCGYFCRWDLKTYLSGLTLNHDPPDLSLQSS